MSKISSVDATLLAQMMISGANNLYNHKDEVNELNVFPVPDGDTGTNMSLTSRAMAEELMQSESKTVTAVADKMSFATLRGARGNSGVILSQIFRGISRSLKGKNECSAKELAVALKDGAQAAYSAVMKPTEGTILTVARCAGEGALKACEQSEEVIDVISGAFSEADIALENTPEQLPQLKQAGVVDAGGQGYCYILEGALSYLKTGQIVDTENVAIPNRVKTIKKVETNQEIKFMYCTEFIINRTNHDLSVDELRENISKIGDCMLVIDDEEIIKVHIHSNTPGYVLEQAVKYGELVDIKIDNMKYQHNSILDAPPKMKVTTTKTKKTPRHEKQEKNLKEYGFVAVSAGKGLSDILYDLGVDRIIEGGQTMNPSTNDILKAVGRVNSKNVFVFPNNKNIVMAATQAAELSDKNVVVIPTTSIPQCISAMLKFDEKKTVENNELALNKAVRTVKSAQVTYAIRDTEYEGRQIKKGDILGILEGKIYAIGKQVNSVCEKLVERMYDEDSEFITLYSGKNVRPQNSDDLLIHLTDEYEDCEVTIKNGGQPLYYYIISVE